MKNLMIITLSIASTSAFAHGGPVAGPVLIAHNAAHKVERLVTMRKVDQHFQDRFSSIQIQALTPANHDDPSFKATVSQVPDATGKAQQVEVLLDDAGKALSYNVITGPESLTAPIWPNADALTLGENSIHYMQDNATAKPELKPFLSGLTSVTMSQIKDVSGKVEARIVMKSKDTKSTLEVVLNADGTVASSKVITPTNLWENQLADHQGGGNWTFLGCVQSYHECEHLGHDSGFNYHSVTHDHQYCTSAWARFTCWGTN